jgi:hypothetical protein
MSQAPMEITRLDIPGTRDEMVKAYYAWQQGQVRRDNKKEDYRRAYDYLIEHNIDLELVYQNNSLASDLQEKAKVKRGAAWQVISDVGHGAKRYRQDKTQDQTN